MVVLNIILTVSILMHHIRFSIINFSSVMHKAKKKKHHFKNKHLTCQIFNFISKTYFSLYELLTPTVCIYMLTAEHMYNNYLHRPNCIVKVTCQLFFKRVFHFKVWNNCDSLPTDH